MADLGFPIDEYTPHGYLANPFAVAHSWTDGEGGCLRTSREHVGLGWQLPWSLRAKASFDLIVTLVGPDEELVQRTSFDATGLTSSHHTSRLLVYRWITFGRVWEASYTLIERDLLGLEVSWRPTESDERGADGRARASTLVDVAVSVGLIGARQPDIGAGGRQTVSAETATVASQRHPEGLIGWVDLGGPYGRCELLVDGGPYEQTAPTVTRPARHETPGGNASASESDRITIATSVRVGVQASGTIVALARRVESDRGKRTTPCEQIGELVGSAVARARREDAAFWSGAARLDGDWPDSWRRGWVYDVETTRMCIYPPGGIFADVWPAWMVQWPRAVVAEGTLDLVRLAFASPALAQRAALSLFRDAPAPNVPCVFQHGEPNMVAKDGSICGTSPAWCVPFYNLERLFALTLDREWLTQIYPFLARYVEWWLDERTDADGWAVYKCTWEAGEDDTPRLDPERRGDNVVAAFVRPVELQATMALSAGVLARFAGVLGRPEEVERWQQVEADFAARTGTLWDAAAGRFRDWDARAGRFLEPAGESNYWGIDPCRFSALAFTPVLAGLVDVGQQQALSRELRQYAGPPWTLWASWSYVVLEAATRIGERAFASTIAAEIVGRVYDELDARQIAAPSHPTPGVAREYWPLDLNTWASCEGYGWGANTASLVIRQIFGFLEGPYGSASEDATGALGPSDAAVRTDTETASRWQGPARGAFPDVGAADIPALEGRSRTGSRSGSATTTPMTHDKPVATDVRVDSVADGKTVTTGVRFRLAPSLPATFLIDGRVYRLANLPYRGAQLTLSYQVVANQDGPDRSDSGLRLEIVADGPSHCSITAEDGTTIYRSTGALDLHEVDGANGRAYDVLLVPQTEP